MEALGQEAWVGEHSEQEVSGLAEVRELEGRVLEQAMYLEVSDLVCLHVFLYITLNKYF